MARVFFFIIVLVLASHSDAFLSRLIDRVQKNWMTSWERMRDQQVRPRLFAQLNLSGSPTLVQALESDVGKVDLAVSLFNSTSQEIGLLRIENIADWLQHRGAVSSNMIGREMGWPNAVGRVENDLMPDSETTYWWMTSTFYPPQGTEGQIVLLPVIYNQTSPPTPMFVSEETNRGDWYYSMIDWVDMNQDGWPDIVTSRSRGMPGSIKFSELIWLENPGYRSIWSRVGRWRSHPITNGPDVSFRILRIPLPSGSSRLVIIGAGYWDNKLYAVWSDDPAENWANVDSINERVIDNHGWFFDLQIADINADGRDDVIVSTWVHGLQQGSVIVYEIPCDFIRDKWRRHTLVDGAVEIPLPDLGSGGKINIFHPVLRYSSVSARKKKPFIIVSGDDDGRVYVLIPNSKKTNNWEYSSHSIYKAAGPVGALTIDDLNHDGYAEIVIPVVESNKLVFFTYDPAAIGPHYFVDETRPGMI
uniref:Uncharacterized LOC100186859 n=1 Tax=Ciona intestinalis TaxID=7719 RepID=F6XZ84_CIOIN|nr:uncharacterized protein LOC100186859 [Ciona intestinalis]|eukprot:XP_002121068.1 uncharacterized protein LOC100186859 [Ciona intestinalis]